MNQQNDLIFEWVNPYIPHLAKFLLMIFGGVIVGYVTTGHLIGLNEVAALAIGYALLRLIAWIGLSIGRRYEQNG